MRSLFALAASLALSAPVRASGRAVSPAPQPSLPVLAGALDLALPPLSSERLLVPSWDAGAFAWTEPDRPVLALAPLAGGRPVPAAWDPRRAAVLAERGRDGASKTDAPRLPPERLLEATNAVLRDFSPASLRSLPEERLHALAALVLDQAGAKPAAPPELALEGLRLVSRARAEAVLKKRGKPVQSRALFESKKDMQVVPYYVTGTPDTVRAIRPAYENGAWGARRDALSRPDAVFRHYSSEDGIRSILASGRIWNGFYEYIELIPHLSRTFFRDLTGTFFTTPDQTGRAVGVGPDASRWVDVRLSPSIPLLQPDPRYEIYLVPLPRRSFDRTVELYRQWARGEALSESYRETAESVDKDGGPGPELAVPVEVVSEGKVEK